MARKERGSAIAMVVIFLAIVGLIAIVTSSQSSFVRRTTARSFYGFEAVEVCESAVNEAHAQLKIDDIFPPQIMNDMQGFCKAVGTNDIAKIRNTYGAGGYTVKTRRMLNATGAPTGQELFTCLIWPPDKRPTAANKYGATGGKMKDYDVPLTEANAKAIPGFKKLSKVEMSVLGWRRDYPLRSGAQAAWQDWGVVHYRVTAEFNDGKNTVLRTMHVDRMFTLYAHFRGGECPPGNPCPPPPGQPATPCPPAGTPKIDPHDPPDPPDVKAAEEAGCPDVIYVHFLKSKSNLKTVILRS